MIKVEKNNDSTTTIEVSVRVPEVILKLIKESSSSITSMQIIRFWMPMLSIAEAAKVAKEFNELEIK